MAFRFNPLTGQLDMVNRKSTKNIVTHELAITGNLMYVHDLVNNVNIPLGPLVVCDNDGNVVWFEE